MEKRSASIPADYFLDKNRNERQKLMLLIEAAKMRGTDTTRLEEELDRLVVRIRIQIN